MQKSEVHSFGPKVHLVHLTWLLLQDLKMTCADYCMLSCTAAIATFLAVVWSAYHFLFSNKGKVSINALKYFVWVEDKKHLA